MIEVGASKGRDLRLKVRDIRYGASRDRLEEFDWLDSMAPHHHLVLGVTVTSARTSSSVLGVGAPLPLPGSLAEGAQQGKLDIDLRASASFGTLSVHSAHDCYPFALEDVVGWPR
jgi:hypothetical protein